jgi:hypothetical protein
MQKWPHWELVDGSAGSPLHALLVEPAVGLIHARTVELVDQREARRGQESAAGGAKDREVVSGHRWKALPRDNRRLTSSMLHGLLPCVDEGRERQALMVGAAEELLVGMKVGSVDDEPEAQVAGAGQIEQGLPLAGAEQIGTQHEQVLDALGEQPGAGK